MTLPVAVGDRVAADLRVLAITPSGAGYAATTWRVLSQYSEPRRRRWP